MQLPFKTTTNSAQFVGVFIMSHWTGLYFQAGSEILIIQFESTKEAGEVERQLELNCQYILDLEPIVYNSADERKVIAIRPLGNHQKIQLA